jgi:hypothetical protein
LKSDGFVNHVIAGGVTGYTTEEAIGQNPRFLQSGNHSRSFYQDLWDVILSGNSRRGEFFNCKKMSKNWNDSISWPQGEN